MRTFEVSHPHVPYGTSWFGPRIDDTQGLLQRRFLVGVALSVVLHALLLAFAPKRLVPQGEVGEAAPTTLDVRISPAPAAQAAVEPPQPVPSQPIPRPRTLTTTREAPRTWSMPAPPEIPPPPPQAPPKPAPPLDFAAMVQARQARREAEEDAYAREAEASGYGRRTPDQIASANISRNLRSLAPGHDGTSGVFQILNKGTRHAEFSFYGWTEERRNGWRQVIEVDAGQGGDIDHAIVRRMIELIRQHYQGNFNWESHRLDRVVVLSARPEDTEGLESFLMREFFESRVQ